MTRQEIQRRYYEKNKEAIAEKNRKRYEEKREAILERNKAYNRENPQVIKNATRRYVERHGKEHLAELARKRRESDPERARLYDRRYYARTRDRRLEISKAWREANPELMREIKRRWVENNPERNAETREIWRRNNRALIAAYVRRRTELQEKAFPEWASLEAMNEIYEMARLITEQTGVEHHVDHIIPLTHELVCGLHCEANLQILTAKENLSKGNKFDPSWFE